VVASGPLLPHPARSAHGVNLRGFIPQGDLGGCAWANGPDFLDSDPSQPLASPSGEVECPGLLHFPKTIYFSARTGVRQVFGLKLAIGTTAPVTPKPGIPPMPKSLTDPDPAAAPLWWWSCVGLAQSATAAARLVAGSGIQRAGRGRIFGPDSFPMAAGKTSTFQHPAGVDRAQ